MLRQSTQEHAKESSNNMNKKQGPEDQYQGLEAYLELMILFPLK